MNLDRDLRDALQPLAGDPIADAARVLAALPPTGGAPPDVPAPRGLPPSACVRTVCRMGEPPARSSVTGRSVPGGRPSALMVTSIRAVCPRSAVSGALTVATATSRGAAVEPIAGR